MTELSDWPALVLTAGLATRLRPLSTVRAKAAMPVAGTPIIGRILAWLHAAGVRRVVLNLHHRPETITSIVGDGAQWDLSVRYSWEGTLLGSAGGPRRALPLLEADRFLLINGDTLTDCDLMGIARRHLDSRALVTMAVVPGDVARYGGVLVGPDGIVTGFARATRGTAPDRPLHRTAPHASASTRQIIPPSYGETSPKRPFGREGGPVPWHFIGVQAVCASAFADLPDDRPSETVRALYPALLNQPGSVTAFTSAAEFLDVGTAHDYLSTVALVAAREGRRFDCGDGIRIDAGAHIEDSVIWDRVTVGRDARLRRCVVADDVHVPDRAVYEDSVLVAGPRGLEVSPL